MEIEEKTAASVYEMVRVKLREALEHHATLTDQLEDAAGLVQSMQLACKAGLKAITMNDNMDPDYPGLDEGWGDSGRTWEEQGKYFFIETNYVYGQISDLLKKLKISWKDGYSSEG